jgi:hypothetical protein
VERKRNPPFVSSSPLGVRAPDRAEAGTRPPRDARGLGGRDPAARSGRQNRGQHLPDILDGGQRRQVDPEMLRRVGGTQRRSIRCASASALSGRATRLGTRRLGLGMPRGRPRGLPELPMGETPVHIARATRRRIRTNRLRFLDSGSGKQEITGRLWRIGNYLRHRRALGTNEASMSVHHMFPSRATLPYDGAIRGAR